MFSKSAVACILALGLVVSPASAAPPVAIRVGPETAPASVDTRTRAAFRHAVTSSISEAGLSPSRAYTAYPTIVQLRRYIEPNQKSPTVVCIVSIAVTSNDDVLIATVRGSASSHGAATREALEIATRSAVRGLVETLESNERARKRSKPTAGN